MLALHDTSNASLPVSYFTTLPIRRCCFVLKLKAMIKCCSKSSDTAFLGCHSNLKAHDSDALYSLSPSQDLQVYYGCKLKHIWPRSLHTPTKLQRARKIHTI